MLADIRQRADKAGGIRALSRQWGVSAAYLSDILLSRRIPGPAVLRKIGWKRRSVTVHFFERT